MLVSLDVYNKRGEWVDSDNIEINYETRKELIKHIKNHKKQYWPNNILVLTREDKQRCMGHVFL